MFENYQNLKKVGADIGSKLDDYHTVSNKFIDLVKNGDPYDVIFAFIFQ